jgi:hypothetical protein
MNTAINQSSSCITIIIILSDTTKIRPTVLSEQHIKAGFEATGLIPFCPERVTFNLTVVRTPLPPRTAGSELGTWTAETPRTTTQLEQQALLVQGLLQRPSQSPTSQAIAQLVKGCQLAMNSATILAEENSRLRAANHRQQRKRQQRRHYIAHGGALQAQEGCALVTEAQVGVQQGDQAETPQV